MTMTKRRGGGGRTTIIQLIIYSADNDRQVFNATPSSDRYFRVAGAERENNSIKSEINRSNESQQGGSPCSPELRSTPIRSRNKATNFAKFPTIARIYDIFRGAERRELGGELNRFLVQLRDGGRAPRYSRNDSSQEVNNPRWKGEMRASCDSEKDIPRFWKFPSLCRISMARRHATANIFPPYYARERGEKDAPRFRIKRLKITSSL